MTSNTAAVATHGQITLSMRANIMKVKNRGKVCISHFHIHILGTYYYSNESKYTGDWFDDNMQGFVNPQQFQSFIFYRGAIPGKTAEKSQACGRRIKCTATECIPSLMAANTKDNM